jgi:hypothetical protein
MLELFDDSEDTVSLARKRDIETRG